jgi:hypothetical protein
MAGKKLTKKELGCLAAAIRAGALRQLRELTFAETYYGPYANTANTPGVTGMMEALEAGGCPMLTKLSLSRCCIDQAGFAALTRAVRGGSLSGLQVLELQRCGRAGGAAAGLVEPLAEGGCPSIQALDLSMSGVTQEEMLPLLTALGERRLRQLKSLTLAGEQIAHAGVAALSGAMLQGQDFEELGITRAWGAQGLLTEQDILLLVGQPSPACGGWVGDRQHRC